jgi:hypothetical protein
LTCGGQVDSGRRALDDVCADGSECHFTKRVVVEGL